MGTPDFAVASLQRLLGAGCQVVAVVTAPDRPSGRGLRLTPSPVKKAAEAANLPVLQPEKLRDPAFLEQLASFRADLQVVVAFRMLPEVVWAMPTIGTFNLHGSLLPQYRGAAPINWAIINGETETGVTTFFIEKEIDTGQMIFQDTEPIYPDDTAGTLHEIHIGHGVERNQMNVGVGNFQPNDGHPNALAGNGFSIAVLFFWQTPSGPDTVHRPDQTDNRLLFWE